MWQMRHTSISVTTMTKIWALSARTKALDLGLQATEIMISPVNGVHTFFICPDGSQVGWPHAAYYEDKRRSFAKWMKDQRNDKGVNLYDWAIAIYGGDAEGYGGYVSFSQSAHMEELGIDGKCPECIRMQTLGGIT